MWSALLGCSAPESRIPGCWGLQKVWLKTVPASDWVKVKADRRRTVRRLLHNRLRPPYRRIKKKEDPHELLDLLCSAPATPKFLTKDSSAFQQRFWNFHHFITSMVCVSRDKCLPGNRSTMHHTECSSLPSSDSTAHRLLLSLNDCLARNHGPRKEKT